MRKLTLKKGGTKTELVTEGKNINQEISEKTQLAKKYEHDKYVLNEMKKMIENSSMEPSEKKVHLNMVKESAERVQQEYYTNVDERVEKLTNEAQAVLDKLKEKEKTLAEQETKIKEVKLEASKEDMGKIANEVAKQKEEITTERNALAQDLELRLQQLQLVKNDKMRKKIQSIGSDNN